MSDIVTRLVLDLPFDPQRSMRLETFGPGLAIPLAPSDTAEIYVVVRGGYSYPAPGDIGLPTRRWDRVYVVSASRTSNVMGDLHFEQRDDMA